MKKIIILALILLYISPVLAEEKESGKYWNKRGLSYKQTGKYQEAEAAFQKAIQINPYVADYYNNLGRLYFKSGRYEDAIESFKHAARLEPRGFGIYRNMGSAYAQLKKYPQAIESLKKAIRIEPNDPQTHMDLGMVYVLSNDKDSAFKEYRILKELNPRMADNLLKLIHR